MQYQILALTVTIYGKKAHLPFMASFLEDIRYFSGRKQGFEDSYREEFLQTLCDPTVSTNKWVNAITTFLCLEANVTVSNTSGFLPTRANSLSYHICQDSSLAFDFDYVSDNCIKNFEDCSFRDGSRYLQLFLNRIVNMEHLLKAIGCLGRLERVDRWDNYGTILSDLMDASNAVAELSQLM